MAASPRILPRILIVEDDRRLADLVARYLTRHGHTPTILDHGEAVGPWLATHQADLIILDIGLPGIDGLEVCRRIRPDFRGPIMMLTARGDELDEVTGLDAGADDYLPKPVRPEALLARIRAHLRRARREGEGGPSRVEVGDLMVDHGSRRVVVGGREVELTTAEFDLIWLLAQHAGEVMPREDLYNALRGSAYDGLDRAIDLRISKLRRKLGDDAQRARLIKSVRGVGYLLTKDPG